MHSPTSSKKRSGWNLLPYGEAAAHLPALVSEPTNQEKCELLAAQGRVLAQDLRLDRAEPPLPRSAMDGWALRSEDGTNPRRLRGVIYAGTEEAPPLGVGEAIAVMTGGTVPVGADAVVPVELAREQDGSLVLNQGEQIPALQAGQHVRNAGEMGEVHRLLLPKGHRLQAADLIAAGGCGAEPLAVFSRPKVAIFSTGDEVVPWGSAPASHQVRDSNRLGAVLQAQQAGAEVVLHGHIADDPKELAKQISKALDGVDLIITLGGVSVGRRDHLPRVFVEAGVTRLFHGVAMQPGKPLWAGRHGNTFVLGMPGNPVSSFVAFELFAVPLLHALGGEIRPGPRSFEPGLAAETVQSRGRDLFLPALLLPTTCSSGLPQVQPCPGMGSGDWTVLAGAQALLHVPPLSKIEPGQALSFLRLG